MSPHIQPRHRKGQADVDWCVVLRSDAARTRPPNPNCPHCSPFLLTHPHPHAQGSALPPPHRRHETAIPPHSHCWPTTPQPPTSMHSLLSTSTSHSSRFSTQRWLATPAKGSRYPQLPRVTLATAASAPEAQVAPMGMEGDRQYSRVVPPPVGARKQHCEVAVVLGGEAAARNARTAARGRSRGARRGAGVLEMGRQAGRHFIGCLYHAHKCTCTYAYAMPSHTTQSPRPRTCHVFGVEVWHRLAVSSVGAADLRERFGFGGRQGDTAEFHVQSCSLLLSAP